MILVNNCVVSAESTERVHGIAACRRLLAHHPRWRGATLPGELEGVGEALVADYRLALVIYDLEREHAYLWIDNAEHGVELECDLPVTRLPHRPSPLAHPTLS